MPLPLAGGLVAFIVKVLLVKAVVRVLVALGIGIFTYVGATEFFDVAEAQMSSAWGDLPAFVVQCLTILHVDFAISIIFAAWTYRLTFGLTTRWGFVPSAGAP